MQSTLESCYLKYWAETHCVHVCIYDAKWPWYITFEAMLYTSIIPSCKLTRTFLIQIVEVLLWSERKEIERERGRVWWDMSFVNRQKATIITMLSPIMRKASVIVSLAYCDATQLLDSGWILSRYSAVPVPLIVDSIPIPPGTYWQSLWTIYSHEIILGGIVSILSLYT